MLDTPSLVSEQVRQINAAFEHVEESGHGEVAVVIEDGHARRIETTFSLVADDPFKQVQYLARQVQASRRGEGRVSLIVRNGNVTRLEVTISEPVVVPPSVVAALKRRPRPLHA